jgi:hypothetical protein
MQRINFGVFDHLERSTGEECRPLPCARERMHRLRQFGAELSVSRFVVEFGPVDER